MKSPVATGQPDRTKGSSRCSTPVLNSPVLSNQKVLAQKAAREFLCNKHKNCPAAADANGVTDRTKVNYWVNTWKKNGTAEQVVAAHATLEADAAAREKEASKAKAPATPAAKLKYGEDGYREPYSGAYKEAGHLVRSGITPLKAARKVSDQFGVQFSKQSATRAQETTDLSPPKRGPETKYPREGEKKILQLIQEMRALKLPTYSHSVMNIAARLIAGTKYEDVFLSEDGSYIDIPHSWYYRFMGSDIAQPLKLAKGNPLEERRDRWATAENMMHHYDVLASVFIREGIATKNPDYDPLVPNSLRLIIKDDQLHRVLSFDETHWTGDMMGGSNRKVVTFKAEWDTGEVLSSKSSKACTLIGGSNMKGGALPLAAIFSGKSWKPAWTVNSPETTRLDPPIGRPYRPLFTSNEPGGMTHDLGVLMLKMWIEPFCPGVSLDNQHILICDGHGSHLTYEFLKYARERGFVVVLRIPYTSHIAQGEDVIHFFKFKHEERAQKASVFNAKFTDLAVKNKNLGYEDLMTCIRGPWEHAFAEDQCKKAWEVIGVSPFTQSVYWKLNKRQMRMAKKTGSFVTPLPCSSSRVHMLPFVCRGC